MFFFERCALVVCGRTMKTFCLRSCFSVALCLLFVSAALPESPRDKHFLWRVTNVPSPFYILGSIHALRRSDYPFGQEIDEAIGQCKRFVFEYDSYHTDPRLWRRKMLAAQHYRAGTTLRDKIRPETYAHIQRIAKVRASEYDDVKPWAIAFFMVSHPYFHDISKRYGVEDYVLRRASPFAEFGGLETLDENIRVLAGMSDAESEVFLRQTFGHPDRIAWEMSKTIDAYKRGDTNALAAAYASEDREAPFITWRTIDQRNLRWIRRIEAEMSSGKPTMIVVGARHLCGRNSVVTLLQARGYILEQL